MQAFHAFGGYIQGFVMMEGGSIKGQRRGHRSTPSPPGSTPTRSRSCTRCRRYFAECSADEQFEFGLDLMVRGLEARASADAVSAEEPSAGEP